VADTRPFVMPKASRNNLAQRAKANRRYNVARARVKNLNPGHLTDPCKLHECRTAVKPDFLNEVPGLNCQKFRRLLRYQSLLDRGRGHIYTLTESEMRKLETPFIQCMIGDVQGGLQVFIEGCNAFFKKDVRWLKHCLRLLVTEYNVLRAYGPENLGLRYYIVRRKILSLNIGKLRNFRDFLLGVGRKPESGLS